jgi:small subunit ribosomal protein S24e
MELEITEKRENPLLDRIEVQFVVHHANQPTPRRESVREELSKNLKVQKDRVVVDSMSSSFGIHDTMGYAKVYSTKETALKVEREYILKRNKLIKEEKKEKKGEPEEKGKEPVAEEKAKGKQKPAEAEEKEGEAD